MPKAISVGSAFAEDVLSADTLTLPDVDSTRASSIPAITLLVIVLLDGVRASVPEKPTPALIATATATEHASAKLDAKAWKAAQAEYERLFEQRGQHGEQDAVPAEPGHRSTSRPQGSPEPCAQAA